MSTFNVLPISLLQYSNPISRQAFSTSMVKKIKIMRYLLGLAVVLLRNAVGALGNSPSMMDTVIRRKVDSGNLTIGAFTFVGHRNDMRSDEVLYNTKEICYKRNYAFTETKLGNQFAPRLLYREETGIHSMTFLFLTFQT